MVEVADVSPRWISILRMLANVAAYMGGGGYGKEVKLGEEIGGRVGGFESSAV